MKLNKIIPAFMIGILLLSLIMTILAGCASSPGANKTLPTFSEDNRIIRGAWWCPKPTKEAYSLYKDCGLNTIFHANHDYLFENEGYFEMEKAEQFNITIRHSYYVGTPKGYNGVTMAQKSLDLAKEMDLFVILNGANIYNNFAHYGSDVYTDHDIDYDKYQDTIVGVFAGDEPPLSRFEQAAAIIPSAEQHFPQVPIFCNLYPSYADAATLGTSNHFDYLEQYGNIFLEKCNGPRLMSTDFYPFIGDRFGAWLFDYLNFTNTAKKYNADTHMFIQSAVSEDGTHRELNETEIRLQVNVALAFGADAYSYFLYEPAYEGFPVGLVNDEGQPSSMYYHAQAANQQASSIEKAYCHYDYVTTATIVGDSSQYQTGAFSYFQTSLENVLDSEILASYQSTNRALLAQLRDENGNEAYYLVNFYDAGDAEENEDCTITLNFDKMKYASLYGTMDCLEGEEVKLDSGTFEYTLKPGEGILVIPYRK